MLALEVAIDPGFRLVVLLVGCELPFLPVSPTAPRGTTSGAGMWPLLKSAWLRSLLLFLFFFVVAVVVYIFAVFTEPQHQHKLQ